jgi:homoserine kinase type II
VSVYTCVDVEQLESFLRNYPLGSLVNYAGIEDGIENTNYLLTTTQGDFVLTLFEWFNPRQLGYFLRLLQHLQKAQFPCPEPQPDYNGRLVKTLAGKPAALFKRIAGTSIEQPEQLHCQQVGTQLAKLHCDAESFPIQQANSMNLRCCYRITEKIKPRLSSTDYQQIIAELEFQADYSQVKLPQGLIHGDLFKDNVLFNHGQLSGILDFYNARHDSWLVDLAITANAWSHSQNGEINRDTLNSLLESYQQIRTLTTLELQLLPVMLRASALRFWLSRLEHQLFPRTGQLTQEKDPRLYRYILEQHQVWKHQF